jgi:ABC-type multidrug transport system ATPase subunit
VAFLKDGTIKACGRPQELKRELRLGDTILVSFQGSLPVSTVSLLQNIRGVYGLQARNSSCTILVDDHKERLPQVLDVFVSNQIFINDIRIQESNLEDVFITFAGRDH